MRWVTVNAETILAAGVPKLQGLGMTFRKAEYITDFAKKVHAGAFDLDAVEHMSDEDAHPGAQQPERHRRLDGRDDPAVLLCSARIFSATTTLPSSAGCVWYTTTGRSTAELFEKYRRRFQPLLQRGKPVSLGRGRRRNPGNEGLQAEKQRMTCVTFVQHYDSPLGGILLAADEIGLTRSVVRRAEIFCARDLPGAAYANRNIRFCRGEALAGHLFFRAAQPDFTAAAAPRLATRVPASRCGTSC